jgi:hypothetical protein
MYALAHTSAKSCYLSLGKSVIAYLKPLYIFTVIDTKIKKYRSAASAQTMEKAR